MPARVTFALRFLYELRLLLCNFEFSKFWLTFMIFKLAIKLLNREIKK